MKVDCRAEVTAIPDDLVFVKKPLELSDRILKNASRQEMKVKRMFALTISHGNKIAAEQI